MNNFKKLLVLILSVALILPLIGLSGCRGPDEFNKGGQPTVAPTQAMLQLAFAGNRYGKYALFVINIDGSGEKQITTWPEDDYAHPSWSPDGILIATQRGPNLV